MLAAAAAEADVEPGPEAGVAVLGLPDVKPGLDLEVGPLELALGRVNPSRDETSALINRTPIFIPIPHLISAESNSSLALEFDPEEAAPARLSIH